MYSSGWWMQARKAIQRWFLECPAGRYDRHCEASEELWRLYGEAIR